MSFAHASALAVAVAAATASYASAATLYSETFDTDVSSSWTTSTGPGTNDATFAYDYSAMGIPNAPGGGTGTLGLRLRANTTGVTTAEALTGLSTSPNGKSFTGDYVVSFYSWQNFKGAVGTTQHAYSGIGVTGTTAQRPGAPLEGLMFGQTNDGGNATDYRTYGPGTTGAQLATAVYAAGGQNNTAAYYTSLFPAGIAAPAAQGSSNTSVAGSPSFAWVLAEIVKEGNTVTYKLNGTTISTVDITSITFAGSNIFLGQSDINSTATDQPDYVFTLIDNLQVRSIEAVPEPTTLAALVGLGGLAMTRRRKV